MVRKVVVVSGGGEWVGGWVGGWWWQEKIVMKVSLCWTKRLRDNWGEMVVVCFNYDNYGQW